MYFNEVYNGHGVEFDDDDDYRGGIYPASILKLLPVANVVVINIKVVVTIFS